VTQQINFALEFWKLFKAEKALKRGDYLMFVEFGIESKRYLMGCWEIEGILGLKMEMREIWGERN
jgi:hypothetical protein